MFSREEDNYPSSDEESVESKLEQQDRDLQGSTSINNNATGYCPEPRQGEEDIESHNSGSSPRQRMRMKKVRCMRMHLCQLNEKENSHL